MIKKQKENVTYLVSDAGKNVPLINLYSLPTKCPVCHTFQEPELRAVQYNDYDDAIVKFCCINESCKTSFTALYLKGSYGIEQYHCTCFTQ